MVDIGKLANELYDITRFQRTPVPFSDAAYGRMIQRGIRRLYLDTGRSNEYHEDMFTCEQVDIGDGHTEIMPISFDAEFKLDDYEAAMLAAQIEFFRVVQGDVNNIVGYSTDAMTVTNSDKPYANLQDTIEKLEDRYKSAIYKHVPYMML